LLSATAGKVLADAERQKNANQGIEEQVFGRDPDA